MKQKKARRARPYEVPGGFRVACEGYSISVEDALQQFADAVTINGWLGRDSSRVAELACEFLRYCALGTADKYHQEVSFPTTERSLKYMAELEATQQSDLPEADKEAELLKILCRWFIYIDNRMSPDFIACQYRIKVSREFLMLCDLLYLNSDYVLFLYMINAGIAFQEMEPLDTRLCLCSELFQLSCGNPQPWKAPPQELLECLYRR